jgi:plasmid stabilization system protein ParE
MTYSLSLLREVHQDIEDAYTWYEARRTGLGNEFLEAVEHMLDRIAKGPLAFPKEEADRRKAVLSRFPFSIYFEVHNPEVIIIAVFHTAQREDTWKRR